MRRCFFNCIENPGRCYWLDKVIAPQSFSFPTLQSRGLTEVEAVKGGGGGQGSGDFGSLMDSLDDCKQVGCRIMVLFSSVWTILFSFILFSHRGYFHLGNF